MKIAKAITAAAVPLGGSLVLWWATGAYNGEEIGTQLIAVVTAVSVYIVPNKPVE